MGKLVIYKRKDGKWAWKLKAANGRTIANDSGQGYENLGDCEQMAYRILTGEFTEAAIAVLPSVDSAPATPAV